MPECHLVRGSNDPRSQGHVGRRTADRPARDAAWPWCDATIARAHLGRWTLLVVVGRWTLLCRWTLAARRARNPAHWRPEEPAAPRWRPGEPAEIGRASCRERV